MPLADVGTTFPPTSPAAEVSPLLAKLPTLFRVDGTASGIGICAPAPPVAVMLPSSVGGPGSDAAFDGGRPPLTAVEQSDCAASRSTSLAASGNGETPPPPPSPAIVSSAVCTLRCFGNRGREFVGRKEELQAGQTLMTTNSLTWLGQTLLSFCVLKEPKVGSKNRNQDSLVAFRIDAREARSNTGTGSHDRIYAAMLAMV